MHTIGQDFNIASRLFLVVIKPSTFTIWAAPLNHKSTVHGMNLLESWHEWWELTSLTRTLEIMEWRNRKWIESKFRLHWQQQVLKQMSIVDRHQRSSDHITNKTGHEQLKISRRLKAQKYSNNIENLLLHRPTHKVHKVNCSKCSKINVPIWWELPKMKQRNWKKNQQRTSRSSHGLFC